MGHDRSQVVVNPGFEAGDTREWTKVTVAAGEVFAAINGTAPPVGPARTNYSGVRVSRIVKGAAGGDVIVRSDAFLPCRPGQAVEVTGAFLPHVVPGGTLEVNLGVQWYDAHGDLLNTAVFSLGEISESLVLSAGAASGTWTRSSLTFLVPDTAAYFQLRVRLGGSGFSAMEAFADSLAAFLLIGDRIPFDETPAVAPIANATLTGATRLAIGYNLFEVSVTSDRAGGSASTLFIEESRDGTTFVTTATVSVPTGTPIVRGLCIQITRRFVRAVFLNGSQGQGATFEFVSSLSVRD